MTLMVGMSFFPCLIFCTLCAVRHEQALVDKAGSSIGTEKFDQGETVPDNERYNHGRAHCNVLQVTTSAAAENPSQRKVASDTMLANWPMIDRPAKEWVKQFVQEEEDSSLTHDEYEEMLQQLQEALSATSPPKERPGGGKQSQTRRPKSRKDAEIKSIAVSEDELMEGKKIEMCGITSPPCPLSFMFLMFCEQNSKYYAKENCFVQCFGLASPTMIVTFDGKSCITNDNRTGICQAFTCMPK